MPKQPDTLGNPDCPICLGSGYFRYDLPVGHDDYGRLHVCECRTTQIISALAAHSRLTQTEQRYTLDMFSLIGRPGTSEMILKARAFVEKPLGFLTFCGETGVGKSSCLMSIVNACIKRQTAAIYITFADLLSYVREAYKPESKDSDWDRIQELARVPVLCIDEIDKVKETEWVQQTITNILDIRYRNAIDGKSGTVIAFNGNVTTIPHKWIVSRMQEGVIVFNNDKDLRPDIAKVREELSKEGGK